eukprot:760272-Hanusia_phi.AAC.5
MGIEVEMMTMMMMEMVVEVVVELTMTMMVEMSMTMMMMEILPTMMYGDYDDDGGDDDGGDDDGCCRITLGSHVCATAAPLRCPRRSKGSKEAIEGTTVARSRMQANPSLCASSHCSGVPARLDGRAH